MDELIFKSPIDGNETPINLIIEGDFFYNYDENPNEARFVVPVGGYYKFRDETVWMEPGEIILLTRP